MKYLTEMDTSRSKYEPLLVFLTFIMSLCWSVLVAIFHAFNEKTYGISNNYWRCLQNWILVPVDTSTTIVKWSQIHSNRFLWTSKPYSRAAKFFTVSPRSLNIVVFNHFEKYIGAKAMEYRRNQDFWQWTNRK